MFLLKLHLILSACASLSCLCPTSTSFPSSYLYPNPCLCSCPCSSSRRRTRWLFVILTLVILSCSRPTVRMYLYMLNFMHADPHAYAVTIAVVGCCSIAFSIACTSLEFLMLDFVRGEDVQVNVYEHVESECQN